MQNGEENIDEETFTHYIFIDSTFFYNCFYKNKSYLWWTLLFFPDLEERVFLEIDPSKSTVFETKLSENLMKVEVVSYNDLKESESEFRWKKKLIYDRRINRTTGEYRDTDFFDLPTKKCNKVKANKFQDALNKLDKYSLKVKNERKI